MQDTKNLKQKLKEYEEYVKDAMTLNDHYHVNYWNSEIEVIKRRIENRKRNKNKNNKQYKKAHGHYA